MRFGASVVTFDLRYTRDMPMPGPLGAIPDGLEGGYVAVAIDEADLANVARWDTRAVPAGTYFLWAFPTEDPPDIPITLVTFSRGTVTVAHTGDPIHPSVILPEPSAPFRTASGVYEISIEASDPTGTASVAISARRGATTISIARDLPATTRSVRWDLTGVAAGDWALHAELRDARGLSASAYARYLLEVRPAADAGASEDARPRTDDASDALDAAQVDGEAMDAARADASDASTLDALGADAAGPDAGDAREGTGCGCGAASLGELGAPWLLVALARRRRSAHTVRDRG